ncbi:uncharacterized protein SOCEGT47_027840 [Sorangium cellulosum]|uniref:Thioester reductase (TE) domain-containing protein n=1 Tax=Sorangium cellulosum TaxID=56 RepID=A0A4P2Q0F8_SORCE|nr:hypothetical protein [Sorangium cellulosum]AUX22283.1 uncharacterized protein SOCEGT47_027840 [Sorangium cellulosum]
MTPSTRRTVVVTGATGFLGRNILAALAARPEGEVRAIAACRDPSRLPRTCRGEVLRGDLRLVPWLAGGGARMPLVSDADLGEAFALAATAPALAPYESLNIVGDEQPTFREVVALIAEASGSPAPMFSVPYSLGYAFAALMEALHPVLPGSSPFLSRSLVHVAESRRCATDRARRVLGFAGHKSWRTAVHEAVAELGRAGFPWPRLAQGVE